MSAFALDEYYNTLHTYHAQHCLFRMYHKDGISVYLETTENEIEEFADPSDQDPADPERNEMPAIISAKPNAPFTVVLELTEDFHRFGATALELTLAIGHNEQKPKNFIYVQSWHIPLDRAFEDDIKIDQQRFWDCEDDFPWNEKIRIPAPEGSLNTSWVLQGFTDFSTSLQF